MGHAALRGLMQTPKPKSTTYHLALLSKRIMVRFMATWIRTAALPTWTRPVFCSTYCAPLGGSVHTLIYCLRSLDHLKTFHPHIRTCFTCFYTNAGNIIEATREQCQTGPTSNGVFGCTPRAPGQNQPTGTGRSIGG